MTYDLINAVWSAMRVGEYYGPADLANRLGQPAEAVGRVLEFLAKYGFADQLTKHEIIVRKLPNGMRPGDALTVLQKLMQSGQVNDVEKVADPARAPKRLKAT
jgi:hypothetical protein